MAEIVAPSLEDARAAGRALVGAGAREVLAYGSVAGGGGDAISDIDLVAIFDDVDYNQRWRLKQRLVEVAQGACGRLVDIWVTDVPEWAAQNKMASSFAAAVQSDLVRVASSTGDDSAVRWDKPQALPDTDIEASYHHLEETWLRLDDLCSRTRDDSPWRHVFASEAAAVVIEDALRALGAAAQIDARALHSRDIAAVVAHLHGEDQAAARSLILSDEVTFDDVTTWRAIRRADGNDHRWFRMMPDAKKIATAAGAEALAAAAMGVLEYASDKIARLHGRRPVNDRITRALKLLRHPD